MKRFALKFLKIKKKRETKSVASIADFSKLSRLRSYFSAAKTFTLEISVRKRATRTYKPHTLIFLSSKGNDNSLFLSLSPSFLNRNEIVSLGSLQREAEREREREKEILRYVRISGPSLTFEHEIKSTVIFRENLLVFFLPLPATLSPYSQR